MMLSHVLWTKAELETLLSYNQEGFAGRRKPTKPDLRAASWAGAAPEI